MVDAAGGRGSEVGGVVGVTDVGVWGWRGVGYQVGVAGKGPAAGRTVLLYVYVGVGDHTSRALVGVVVSSSAWACVM